MLGGSGAHRPYPACFARSDTCDLQRFFRASSLGSGTHLQSAIDGDTVTPAPIPPRLRRLARLCLAGVALAAFPQAASAAGGFEDHMSRCLQQVANTRDAAQVMLE